MWARREPLLPPAKGPKGRPITPHRPVVEGIVFRYRTGVSWRELPEQLGLGQTVWNQHRHVTLDGTSDAKDAP